MLEMAFTCVTNDDFTLIKPHSLLTSIDAVMECMSVSVSTSISSWRVLFSFLQIKTCDNIIVEQMKTERGAQGACRSPAVLDT